MNMNMRKIPVIVYLFTLILVIVIMGVIIKSKPRRATHSAEEYYEEVPYSRKAIGYIFNEKSRLLVRVKVGLTSGNYGQVIVEGATITFTKITSTKTLIVILPTGGRELNLIIQDIYILLE